MAAKRRSTTRRKDPARRASRQELQRIRGGLTVIFVFNADRSVAIESDALFDALRASEAGELGAGVIFLPTKSGAAVQIGQP